MPTDSGKSGLPHLVRQVPPTSIASPSQLRPRDVRALRWYKPTLIQSLSLLGWRWLYFLPAAAMVLSLVLFRWNLWLIQFMVIWWKLAVFAIAIPFGYAMKAARDVLRSRKEPFCIHCGYDLTGLPDNHTCPECGEPFTYALIEEYKRDPQWFIERYHRELPPVDVPFEARVSKRPKSRDGT